MVKCVFCGKEEYAFKGVHLIGNDGSVSFLCSSKCRKNVLKLKRDRRKFKWTAAHSDERKKTIAKEAKKLKGKEAGK
jgi:large subunit ribosomal protein L24e